jgi:hypothetical protein
MFSSTNWMIAFAVLGGLVAAWRIYQNLQKLHRQKNDSWDARLIDQLRKRGTDPFKPHDVDFFFAFPAKAAAEELAAQLRTEGFDADVIETPDTGDLHYSLHAHKSMQLTVPDMQALSRRLSDAANLRNGRYDGWSAKQVPRDPGPPA